MRSSLAKSVDQTEFLFLGSSLPKAIRKKETVAARGILSSCPSAPNLSFLEKSIGYAIHRARMAVMTDMYRVFRDYRLTATDFLVLVVVADNPGLRQADLAKALDVERPRMVPTLNKLERRGLAKRTVLAGDGRVRQVQLTKRGHQLVRILKRRFDEHQKRALARLDPAEIRMIFSSLRKLAGR